MSGRVLTLCQRFSSIYSHDAQVASGGLSVQCYITLGVQMSAFFLSITGARNMSILGSFKLSTSLLFVLLLSATMAFASSPGETFEDCFADCFKHEAPALISVESKAVEHSFNARSTTVKNFHDKLKQINLVACQIGDGSGCDGWEYWQFYSPNSMTVLSDEPPSKNLLFAHGGDSCGKETRHNFSILRELPS